MIRSTIQEKEGIILKKGMKRLGKGNEVGGQWWILGCHTLCDPMDYTIHGIPQARILEWVAFPFSRGSSQLKDWTHVSCIAGGFFTSWATREAQEHWSG